MGEDPTELKITSRLVSEPRKEPTIYSRSLAGLIATVALLSSCAHPDGLEVAKNEHLNTPVASRFGEKPQVISDPHHSGVATARTLFHKSETAIVSGPELGAQSRAASISVVAHAPMMVATPETHSDVHAALGEMGVNTVLVVGGAAPLDLPGVRIVTDPGTDAGLEELTALKFKDHVSDDLITDLANSDSNMPTQFRIAGQTIAQHSGESGHFPIQSKQDGGDAPPILATRQSSIASVATARAFGANVTVLAHADPRYNIPAAELTAGMNDKAVIALGDEFGSGEEFQRRLATAARTPQQPGGGGLVFPGRRIVALYGHPSGPALGELGERPPAEAAAEAKRRAQEFQPRVQEPVIPAFEIIATVASSEPGDDGDFANESQPEELIPYIDAITAVGGYAIVDLQPGKASLLAQAKRYEELLKRPNVGLAIDPEWKLGPHGKPAEQVGHIDAAEANEVSAWLAELTRSHALPQKPFVLHQFQTQMIRQRENLEFHDELAMIVHVDGHGSEEEKFSTWDAVRQGLDPRIHVAWKNFHDEDKPMFTPEQTMAVEPRPWLVTYQ